jgi:hypothetical protein
VVNLTAPVIIRVIICVTLLTLTVPIGSGTSQQGLEEHITIKWCQWATTDVKGQLHVQRQVMMDDKPIGTPHNQLVLYPGS